MRGTGRSKDFTKQADIDHCTNITKKRRNFTMDQETVDGEYQCVILQNPDDNIDETIVYFWNEQYDRKKS